MEERNRVIWWRALLATAGCALFFVWLLHERAPSPSLPQERVYSKEQQLEGLIPSFKEFQEDFVIFRTPAEGLPQSLRHVLGKPRFGLRWSRAQFLPNESPINAWAVPGRETVCLFTRDGLAVGSTCDRSNRAARLGLGIALLTPQRPDHQRGGRTIIGIAPVASCKVLAKRGNEVVRISVNRGIFFIQDQVMAPPDRYEARSC